MADDGRDAMTEVVLARGMTGSFRTCFGGANAMKVSFEHPLQLQIRPDYPISKHIMQTWMEVVT